MPAHRSDWSPLNIVHELDAGAASVTVRGGPGGSSCMSAPAAQTRLCASHDSHEVASLAQVWMNQIDRGLREELERPVFQTWNPIVEPDPSTVRCDYGFERPVVTSASVEAMRRLDARQVLS